MSLSQFHFDLSDLIFFSLLISWSTHWFSIDIDLSRDSSWKNQEVRLRWNSGSEAQVSEVKYVQPIVVLIKSHFQQLYF